MAQSQTLTLAFGIDFQDLYRRNGLIALDSAFLDFLGDGDPALRDRLDAGRANPDALQAKQESALILEIAPRLERFVAELFGVTVEVEALTRRHKEQDPLFAVKRQFVQRRAVSRIAPEEARRFDGAALERELRHLFGGRFDELTYATHVARWLQAEDAHSSEIDLAMRYAAWALHSEVGREHVRRGVLFKAPSKIDPHNLLRHVEAFSLESARAVRIDAKHLRRREGFGLTDPGANLVASLDHANYCIWCHTQGKDSCSKGLLEKSTETNKLVFKKSAFGVTLAGCPLEEKISEFQTLKAAGCAIGALAVICIDNPMVAATGHRICNDCMKSCIYQKQDPVDVPQVETRTLKDVLGLPWGFEIYSLLTRWNPLNLRRPLPLPRSGYRVLVVGMGPAGFSLAHHLMNDGHTVVGIDGLKIEPLPPRLSGVLPDGRRCALEAIHDAMSLYEPLDERVMAGFGGVAEYGITVRWDKNFLKLVRLIIERRENFALFGGVRFGGTITLDDVFAAPDSGGFGFDHVALCMGAGKPTTLNIPNALARGARTASDFLMALQLTGAAHRDSVVNMQLRLPIVVIGGGLTAIDSATESLAYYVVQVEKFLDRYRRLAELIGEDAIRAEWDPEEREIAEEFLSHARAIRSERRDAARAGRPRRIAELLAHWGGATIAYRRRLIDSPSYTLNHEEVGKALEEGVVFAEELAPLAIETDEYGAARAVRFARTRLHAEQSPANAGEVTLPARTVLVAAGTQPNTVLAREDPQHFALDGKYFQACDEEGKPVTPTHSFAKPARAEVLMSRVADGRFVSYFGDLHPSYSGNVVKALASTKQGHRVITGVLAHRPPASALSNALFFERLDCELRATVHEVKRLTPTIVEVIVKAPAAARRFRPGQFYRLQNYAVLAPVAAETRLQMEGLALTGAWVDRDRGLVSTIVLEMGGSSDLCAMLGRGEPVVLMGPTGSPTHIAASDTAILVGGGLGNAVLFSIGQALRAAGSRVLYFAGYKKEIDRYKVAEIEAAADVIVWCCDEEPGFQPKRPQDRAFVGNLVQGMEAYAAGRLASQPIALREAQRMIVIGSDRMMAAVARARHGVLAQYLNPQQVAIGSINSPMQCMMKEICGQCLQLQRDPRTGELSQVFSCFNQDQRLDHVDFQVLSERLRQNSLQEKLTAQWTAQCLAELNRRRGLVLAATGSAV
jgi:NADPH-dependent glutamate synthase beta subunit-like oxidoreductase/NAD(P)H-flavin reductase